MNDYTAAKIKKRSTALKRLCRVKKEIERINEWHEASLRKEAITFFIDSIPTSKNNSFTDMNNNQNNVRKWILPNEDIEIMNKRMHDDVFLNPFLGKPWKPKKSLKSRILNFINRRL